MRASTLSIIGAVIAAVAGIVSTPASAGGRENPNGYGLYSPDVDGTYRYDPRSWYYRQRRHYPHYGSSYWVPRSDMRYRYRYQYYGPKYGYYPAWGYPRPGHNIAADNHWHWDR